MLIKFHRIMQYTFIKKVIIERVTTALSYDVAIVVDCSLTGALVAILRKNRTVFKEYSLASIILTYCARLMIRAGRTTF